MPNRHPFTANLRNRFTTEILHREFGSLGTVTRLLHSGDPEEVDLVISAGLSGPSAEALTGLGATLTQVPHEFTLTEIESHGDRQRWNPCQ